MLGLRGLAWLLAFQSAGELLVRALQLPFPGPVVGMLLLVPALQWRVVRTPVTVAAEFLLRLLSLLFVPVGVGVMTHLSLVAQYGLRMLLVVVASCLLGLLATVLTLQWLSKPPDNRPENPPGRAPHA